MLDYICMLMESRPIITQQMLLEALQKKPSEEMAILVDKINANYEYWDSVKYKRLPAPYTNKDLWTYVVAERLKHDTAAWNRYGIHFGLTNMMQRQCHDMDMNFGGYWGNSSIIPDNKERYLVSSLMEEAISSSQMEGASTTRKIAKEMLRKKISPKGKSQQMIHNNYQTIQFIVENKNQPLTEELLLTIHRLMTEKTLENEVDAGRFRINDDVVVENGVTHDVVHIPPSFKDIPIFIEDLCSFFNEESETNAHHIFIHPIIKAIIIHFMIAYMHPFVDGNGRTARALFYWYMLKQGYWLTEYLSISRIIYRRKNLYEKSFLYAENDHNDIGYFIAYNLHVLNLAFVDLQKYLKRKSEEKVAANSLLRLGNLNIRQAEIIQTYLENSQNVLTVKDVQVKFGISPTTAKADLKGLMQLNILQEISFNKVKKGYIKGEDFDDKVKL